MQHKLLLFLVQCMIFCNQYNFTYSKAMFGNGVRNVEENEFLSVVCLNKARFHNGGYRESNLCTGTLISSSHVITAAHCFQDVSDSVVLVIYGSVDTRFGTKLQAMWWIAHEQWAAHIGLDIQPFFHDIAILRVIQDVPDRIVPAFLSPVATTRLYGLDCMMVGCGYSPTFEFPTNVEAVDVKIMSNAACNERARDVQGGFWFRFSNKDFCSAREPFALMSDGDSGGPILYRNYIVGINSGTYPKLLGHFDARQVNYHIGTDYYRHFIEVMLGM